MGKIELHGFGIVKWGPVNENAVHMLLKACRRLRSLSIQSNSPYQSRVLLDAVGQHSPDLRTLEIITLPYPTTSKLGITKIFPLPENPRTPYISVFRASSGLESLTIDITDLLEIAKLMEKNNKHTGILSPHTFVMASVGEILVNVDLALPKILRSLKLRVSNGEKQRAATMRALRAFIMDQRAQFPHMERLKTSWQQPFTRPPKGKNVGDDLVGIMEHAGLEYVETYFPDAAAVQDHSAPDPEDW